MLTSLTKEALPVLRYRTRDLTALHYGPCPCGRTFVRMERVHGRTDDMLIIRGVNVFPSQIETALLEVDGTEPHYRIIVDREGGMDTLTVEVEVSPSIFQDEMKGDGRARKEAHRQADQHARHAPASLRLVEPKSITRSEGKAKRVIDNRKG